MEIRMHLSIGLVGCQQEGEIELEPQEAAEWAEMTDDERHEFMREPLEEFMWNHVETWWEEA